RRGLVRFGRCLKGSECRKVRGGFFELCGQVAVADDAVTFAVKRVLAAKGAQNHLRMAQKITIERELHAVDVGWSDMEPGGISMVGRLAFRTLTKEYDVGDHGGAFAFEGIGGQA